MSLDAAAPNAVLSRLIAEQEVLLSDGRRKPLFPTGLNPRRGAWLFELVRSRRPALTIELGFAYGISTLYICEALRQNGTGHHIVIDPKERSHFDGAGLRHLEQAGLASLVTFYEEPAELRLPKLIEEGVRVDFAFDDSDHLFDHVITEFLFLARLVRKDGMVVFDDVGLPGVGRAVDFIATNRADFAEVGKEPAWRGFFARVPAPPKGLRAFRKVADEDPRGWNDFTPF
jgi:predicted O-methyltransferase YrrM